MKTRTAGTYVRPKGKIFSGRRLRYLVCNTIIVEIEYNFSLPYFYSHYSAKEAFKSVFLAYAATDLHPS